MTISPPSGTRTSGARYAAAPTAAFTACATGPPLNPNHKTAAMKTPAPTSPSPTSSGCGFGMWNSPRGFLARRFLTRLGVFGDVRWGRFLRAMAGHFAPPRLTPPARTRR